MTAASEITWRMWKPGPSMPGAVGVSLWSKPLLRRSGSVSVWRSTADLRAFVGTPLHVSIMNRNRGRGLLRSTKWSGSSAPAGLVWRRASSWLADPVPSGGRLAGGRDDRV